MNIERLRLLIEALEDEPHDGDFRVQVGDYVFCKKTKDVYIVAVPNSFEFVLIRLNDGNRWNDAKEFKAQTRSVAISELLDGDNVNNWKKIDIP